MGVYVAFVGKLRSRLLSFSRLKILDGGFVTRLELGATTMWTIISSQGLPFIRWR